MKSFSMADLYDWLATDSDNAIAKAKNKQNNKTYL